jgi:hypothetical protein
MKWLLNKKTTCQPGMKRSKQAKWLHFFLFMLLLGIPAFAQGPTFTIDWDWETANIVYVNGTPHWVPWYIGATTDVPVEIGADHLKEDGWVLLWSNLDGHMVDGVGNPVVIANYHPYFALYNRYRGIIRFFYLHQTDVTTSDLMYGLTFEGFNGGMTSMLSYTFEFAKATGVNLTQPFVTRANLSQLGSSGPAVNHWYYFDVETAYHDVTGLGASDLVMRWLARGIDTSTLTLSGTQTGSIDGSIQISGSNVTYFKTSSLLNFDTGDHIETTNTINSNVGGSTKVSEKASNQFSTLLKNKFNDLASSLLSKTANLLTGGLTDLFGGLVGGGEKDAQNNQNVHLRYQTEIELTGTLSKTLNIFERTLKVPGTSYTSASQVHVPYYDQPLGLIAIPNQPRVKWEEWFEWDEWDEVYQYFQYYQVDFSSVQVVVNPFVANELSIKTIKKEVYLYVKYSGPTTLEGPVDVGGGNWQPDRVYGILAVDESENKYYRGIGITTRYDNVEPDPYGFWEAGEESFGEDRRIVVKITVELERTGVPDADTIVWCKTFIPEYQLDTSKDPLRYVRDLIDSGEIPAPPE